MTLEKIISTAAAYGFTAEIVGGEVHVICNGFKGAQFRYDIIEAGAEYLGQIVPEGVPMGQRIDSIQRVRRFTV